MFVNDSGRVWLTYMYHTNYQVLSFIVSIRICVCNAFLNMASLTSIITFWRQQRCVDMSHHYVHAKNNNPIIFCVPKICICILLHTLNKLHDCNYPVFLKAFKMMYLALKEVGSVEAQMLQWQHTSCFSLNLVRNICGFDSIIWLEVDWIHCKNM